MGDFSIDWIAGLRVGVKGTDLPIACLPLGIIALGIIALGIIAICIISLPFKQPAILRA